MTPMKKAHKRAGLRANSTVRQETATRGEAIAAPFQHHASDGRRAAIRRQHDRAQRRFLACERRQLAQQIHDDLGGILTALMATISVAIEREALAPLQSSPLLLDAHTLADAAFASVRKIGLNLRPILLEEMGLLGGIEWQVRSLASRSGMATSFYYDARLDLATMPDECERVVFRAVSEAITNAEKHSKATRLRVWLYHSDGMHVSCVEDDGVGPGTAPLRRAGSLGIVGMKEQASAIGGSLELRARRGGGMRVCLKIPSEHCDDN
jgi:two-component system sensor histidine kinase UhpB